MADMEPQIDPTLMELIKALIFGKPQVSTMNNPMPTRTGPGWDQAHTQELLKGIDSLGSYKPGPRMSDNIEDRRPNPNLGSLMK